MEFCNVSSHIQERVKVIGIYEKATYLPKYQNVSVTIRITSKIEKVSMSFGSEF